jgi:hypothetical protein
MDRDQFPAVARDGSSGAYPAESPLILVDDLFASDIAPSRGPFETTGSSAAELPPLLPRDLLASEALRALDPDDELLSGGLAGQGFEPARNEESPTERETPPSATDPHEEDTVEIFLDPLRDHGSGTAPRATSSQSNISSFTQESRWWLITVCVLFSLAAGLWVSRRLEPAKTQSKVETVAPSPVADPPTP